MPSATRGMAGAVGVLWVAGPHRPLREGVKPTHVADASGILAITQLSRSVYPDVGGCAGPVPFGWMNGSLLPVIFSIDFNNGPWTSRSASVVLAVVRQEWPDDARVQRLCCHKKAVDLILR